MGALLRRHVPERFLRQLWQHQLFDTGSLRSACGKPLEVLSPGVVNRDSGPDFLDARIRIGGILYCGNVELHRFSSGWNLHGHHLDPLYNAVILHVVFHRGPGGSCTRTKSRRQVPVMVLEEHLSQSYHDLWREMIASERSERLASIPCYPDNATIDHGILRPWLEKLAMERVELKMRRCDQRLRELLVEHRMHAAEPLPRYDRLPFRVDPDELPPPEPLLSHLDFAHAEPWEQLLYEGMMLALGYSKNHELMLRLAQCAKLEELFHVARRTSPEEAVRQIEAVLLRTAGFLSGHDRTYDKATRELIREYKNLSRNAGRLSGLRVFRASDWKFFRLRPENFPTLRLAGAARLVVRFSGTEFLKTIIHLLKEERSPEDHYAFLRELFIVPADGFWKGHYRLGERAAKPVQTLIGRSRADEIILNTVIPVVLLYARIFRDGLLRRHVLALYDGCSAGTPTSITQIILRQLVRDTIPIDRAMMLQGCYQLYKAYCLEDRCSECPVGNAVFSRPFTTGVSTPAPVPGAAAATRCAAKSN